MRKVIVLEHISFDGVIQAPGGPDEDPSGGFPYGGWIAPYSDEILGTALRKQMNSPFEFLRRQLAETLKLRLLPELHFMLDESEKRAQHVEEILNSLKEQPVVDAGQTNDDDAGTDTAY